MLSSPRFTVENGGPIQVAQVTCGNACRTCAGGGETVLALPFSLLDVDDRIRDPRAWLRAQAVAFRRIPRVHGYCQSPRGGLHLYLFDAPVGPELERWAELVGADPSHAAFSVSRGWCGERPWAEGRRPVVLHDHARWPELRRAHAIGRPFARCEAERRL